MDKYKTMLGDRLSHLINQMKKFYEGDIIKFESSNKY